ncbi:MAG TPA: hypothetical protein VJ876_02785 [Bacteroidales bacterium]|nr:hypothetical protein [Bacteroidales bacterium]
MGTLYQAARKRIKNLLLNIYPEEKLTQEFLDRLYALIEEHLEEVTCGLTKWDQTDTVLITNGGSIVNAEEPPLQTLQKFLRQHLRDVIRCVHILPFFSYSNSDGSGIDGYRVDPALGSWQDIEAIHQDFDLMMDLVTNPESGQRQGFHNYPEGRSPEKDLFIEMLRVLFYYIHQGARIISLDDVASLWKDQDTAFTRQPQSHHIVKLIRELAELINPDCIILTETNMPARQNISSFSHNFDEAHMIYQSPLPPLLLRAMHTGDATLLSRWATTIPETDEENTFLNFTASHDAIDVRPLEGILPEDELNRMVEQMKDFGGCLETQSDGSESPYEINITWFDAMKGTTHGINGLQKERFLCSQTIMMEMKGIPAFYLHALTATENDHKEGVGTGKNRNINPKKRHLEELEERLNNRNHPAHQIFHELKRLIGIRNGQPAFNPNAAQKVLELGPEFFVLRRMQEPGETLWAVSNVTPRQRQVDLSRINSRVSLHDLISEKNFQPDQTVALDPYQTLWLKQA